METEKEIRIFLVYITDGARAEREMEVKYHGVIDWSLIRKSCDEYHIASTDENMMDNE